VAGKRPRRLLAGSRAPRADAARNRAAILAAAEALFAERDPADVSMDAIAARAGVGKPTLYRNFGNRAGLVHAIFEQRERGFQAALLRGPAPLGPGAPPVERIAAFLDGYLQLVEVHLEVLLAAETAHPAARFHIGAYSAYHQHLRILLRAAGVASRHQAYVADLLLATTAADLYQHQRTVLGLAAAEIREEARLLAEHLVGAYAQRDG
jgi:AcrR family transcriptional regulator